MQIGQIANAEEVYVCISDDSKALFWCTLGCTYEQEPLPGCGVVAQDTSCDGISIRLTRTPSSSLPPDIAGKKEILFPKNWFWIVTRILRIWRRLDFFWVLRIYFPNKGNDLFYTLAFFQFSSGSSASHTCELAFDELTTRFLEDFVSCCVFLEIFQILACPYGFSPIESCNLSSYLHPFWTMPLDTYTGLS